MHSVDIDGIGAWARRTPDLYDRSFVLVGAAWGLIDLFDLPVPVPDPPTTGKPQFFPLPSR